MPKLSSLSIDHLTVVTPTLALGADYVLQTLGVAPQMGGEHPRMGTHNMLLRLGDDMFLEVIAPNPKATAPNRPRWFGMDHLRATSKPALTTWVIRTQGMNATHAAASEDLGKIEPMSRGAISWLLTIPEDGSVPLDGVAPGVIEWHADKLPASTLEDRGLSLVELQVFHPYPARVSRLLESVGFAGPVTVTGVAAGVVPYLRALIDTPDGVRELSRAA
jgi:Glyoxalase-like domain